MLCLGMMSGSSYVFAQGGIAKTARQTLEIGKNYKLKIEPTNNIIFPDVFNDFKVVTPEDGSLTIMLETFAETTKVSLFNEKGISLEPASEDVISGSSVKSWGTWQNNPVLTLQWNTTSEKFIGSLTWKLDAGTYYLRISRSQKGLSTANLSLGLKDLDGNPVVERPVEF